MISVRYGLILRYSSIDKLFNITIYFILYWHYFRIFDLLSFSGVANNFASF